MDAAQAISAVVEEIRSSGLDYPTDDLRAERFDGGWFVYAPVMIADDIDLETRSVFLVGASGRVKEMTSDDPVESARDWFEESCLWFSAEEPPGAWSRDPSLPSHPDLRSSVPPREPAGYDREAVDVLARALTGERDFSGWLSDRLRELADLVGGTSRLVARRPRASAAAHVRELAEPDDFADERGGVWQTWPAVDPASLPDVDTAGWLLVPLVRTVEILENLESETPAATRLADAIANQAREAPSWRACGVAELLPQLVVVRRADLLDADLDTLRRLAAEDGEEGFVDKMLVPPSPGDVDALLRIAVDAGRREVIDIDVAVTAAYRRVLDRLDLPFENYAYEAMFE